MIELIKQIIEQDGLAEKNRKREIIHKKIFLFTALRKESFTLKRIGALFNMDHTSVLHGLKTFQNLSDVNDKQLRIDTDYYKLLLSLELPELDLRNEIKEARNLVDLRKIQSRIKNNFY